MLSPAGWNMAPGISNSEILDEALPEKRRIPSNIDRSNDSSDRKESLNEVAIILLMIVPAGVIFLYLLVSAMKECLRGCFY